MEVKKTAQRDKINSLEPGSALWEKGEKNRRAKQAERYPGEGKGGGAWNMPLMPPFHDPRFWYHALIGQISSC